MAVGTVAFELIDSDVVAKIEHGAPAFDDSCEWPIVPKLLGCRLLHNCSRFARLGIPSRSSSHGLCDGPRYCTNKACVREATSQFDMKVQVIADICK